MISEPTRKQITNASLFAVLAKMISMAVAFFQNNPASAYIELAFEVIFYLTLIWLGYGLWLFYKDEQEKKLQYISLLIILGGGLAIPLLTVDSLIDSNIIATNNIGAILTQISTILPPIGFLVGFILLKSILDSYVPARRNIFKGQLSLPIGYAMTICYMIILTIVPIESMTIEVEGKYQIKSEYVFLYYVVSFLEMGMIVMVVLGLWYLRKTFLMLDKVPKEYFERMKQVEEYPAQRSYPGTFTRFSRTQSSIIPPSAAKSEPEIIDTTSSSDVASKKKMFCVKCGLELEEDAVFCANCGEKNPYIEN
ncbi:MAG: zinc ribbon domain-containing protein [Candidatus Thorarchaeota archaeon]